ncbi:MAG TPA: sulfatase-like hydrolase/transferase [Thermoanaerobaculia bacterium]|nr:sulfatase-like hydrolase/transferase [Thermoanaerobaculia bacterium]
MRGAGGVAAGRLVAATLAIVGASCAGPPPPVVHDGPVVIVTLGGVRADSVGFLGAEPPGLTPHLDALAARADWSGAAVAPSSVGFVSLASYLTGLGSWVHGVGLGERPLETPAELRTLAEVLAGEGYRTAGYVPAWIARADGWRQGFGFLRDIAGGGRAAGHLASLEGGRDFLWFHLDGAEPPWERQDQFADRLPGEPLVTYPESLSQAELEVLRDPASPSGDGGRSAARAVYQSSLADVDRQLGELLAALETSGQRDDTLLVVASTHGQELAEPAGWGLLREHLEVPLVVDLPARLVAGRDWSPVATPPPAAGLWATIVRLVGAEVAPATIPPLDAASEGVLSELYLGNGVNETSWVEGDLQLLRRVRFVAAGTPIRPVRLARVGLAPPSIGDPARLLADFESAFANSPAWAGRGDAESVLVAWRDGRTMPVEDAARQAAMAAAMARRRMAFVPCDETPERAEARRVAERSAAGSG